MHRIVAAIAANTVRELVRSKLLYNLLLFAALFIGGSLFVAQLTIGNWLRIILDMGLGAIELAGTLLAVIIGVGVVAGEIQRKTILPTLAKPVPRWAFCLGRYAGLVLLLAANVGLMLGVLAAVLHLAGYSLSATAVWAAVLIAVELAVMAAVALLFASFSTPLLAGAYALALFLIGHLISDLQAFAARSKSAALASIARGFYMLLPDLEMLNLKSHAANELAVGGAFVWRAAAYGLCYAAVVLVLAILIFSRRDLN
ncbi:MAG: ABC transporter permease [Deltaproteobacteria bacterium]|nr:MAG: ABC transporter permease [Deltaproteobacteria bacterium]